MSVSSTTSSLYARLAPVLARISAASPGERSAIHQQAAPNAGQQLADALPPVMSGDMSSAVHGNVPDAARQAPQHQAQHTAQDAQAVELAAAQCLQAWGMDEATQAAALLHNFVCIDALSLQELEGALGVQAARKAVRLCEKYTQIVLRGADSGRGRSRARRRVHYFLAAYHDPDLALLAVALLWAQTFHRRAQGGHIGAGAVEDARFILCPVLDMLGMQAQREELHNTLWPQKLEPDTAVAAQALYEGIWRTVVGLLPVARCERRFPCFEGPPAQNQGNRRPGGNMPITIDIAVCVPTAEDCYRAVYHIHQQYQLVEGSFADHLRGGRINGWRALQTAVTIPWRGDRVRINFQIYAQPMEAINRWGLAATRRADAVVLVPPNAWWNRAKQGRVQIEVAEPGALPETLSVFSPQGQLFRFHRGCTVVDFAYHVHTDLADQCRRFYINDEPVEPNAVLHHLDIVALEHDAQALGPTQVWLNAANTTRARNAIERFLNRRGRGIDQGRRILDERRRYLEQHYGFNLPEHRLAQALSGARRQLHLTRPEDLLDELAGGRLSADQLLHPLFAEEIARQVRLERGLRLRPHQLQISQCCRPRPGQDIVGLVNRRHGEIVRLRVHRSDCTRIRAQNEQIALDWRLQPRLTVFEQLEVTAHDQDELLGDTVKEVYSRLPHITLRKVEAAARHGVARLRLHVEAESEEVLAELTAALYALPKYQIVEVRRLRLPPSELEAAESLHTRSAYNPYSRLPVHEQAMFFGRSQELERIVEWLRADAGNIWLLGQKRVGKTSLLFHLKHHFLPERGYTAAFVDFQLLGNLATSNLCYEIAAAIFADLQGDPHIAENGVHLSAPLRSLFDLQPAMELIAYLRALNSRIQAAPGRNRLVILLDEFSRTTDAYLQGQMERSFFELWRGVMQATVPEIGYITVVQQQTYNTIARKVQPGKVQPGTAQHGRENLRSSAVVHEPQPQDAPYPTLDDPSWHIMELGEKLILRPLEGDAVRRLIEWPMRNFLEFSPESVETVAALTGGNPFLIQAFCFKLATHMAHQERRRIETHDIEMVRMEFMLPTESVFAHFLDMLRGIGNQVSQTLAILAEEATAGPAGQVEAASVAWDALHAALPHLPEPVLRRTLQELTTCDILIESPPDTWAFSSRLFQQWLALNAE